MSDTLAAGNVLNQYPANQPLALTDFDPARLAEIHLPESIQFWPVATGWWLLLAVFLIIMLMFIIIRKHRKPSLTTRKLSTKLLAQKELQIIARNYRQNNAQQSNAQQNNSLQNKVALDTLKQLSIFLRRYVLSLTARENVAALTDGEWLEYLDRLTAEDPSKKNLFSKHYANLLQEAPYQRTVEKDHTALIEQLITDLEQLIAESNPSTENHHLSATASETVQKTDSKFGNSSHGVKSLEVKKHEVKSLELKIPEVKHV